MYPVGREEVNFYQYTEKSPGVLVRTVNKMMERDAAIKKVFNC